MLPEPRDELTDVLSDADFQHRFASCRHSGEFLERANQLGAECSAPLIEIAEQISAASNSRRSKVLQRLNPNRGTFQSLKNPG